MAKGNDQKQTDGSSEKFVDEHGGRVRCIAIYGQESNYTIWKLAQMNIAIRGIDANLGPRNAGTFQAGFRPYLKADLVSGRVSPTPRST